MWPYILPYPDIPDMPSSACPLGLRALLHQSGCEQLWTATWHLGVDTGRTEGAAVVLGVEVVLLFVITMAILFYIVLKRYMK